VNVLFTREPQLVPVHDGDGWRLLADFITRVDEPGVGCYRITVPAGFETDLASVPRLPLAYALFGGRARRSAILHDFLYETQAGKDYADEVFLAAMKAEGVGLATRWIMYWAVRAFGQVVYDRKRT
jgi:hypothetical protein